MAVSTRINFRVVVLIAGVLFPLLLAGCGGGGNSFHASTPSSPGVASQNSSGPPNSAPTPTPTPTPTPGPAPTPTPTPSPTPGSAQHGPVVLVVEENHSFSSVIGSSAMPYLNSLAQQYSLAIQYYANTHPSIGNYFMMTAGQIVTNDDSFNGPVNVDNLVRHMMQAGKTWKSYSSGLPSVGYIGGDSGAYLHRHNPLSYFQDVVGSANERQNLVPFTQFAADLNNRQLPAFSFVTPNANEDAHNGTLQQADQWLQTNIAPLLSNPQFQNGGLLLIVFDEADTSDSTLGGGHIAMVAVGPLVKHGFQSSTQYQHQNLLRTITDYLGIDGNIGSAGTAKGMADLLQ